MDNTTENQLFALFERQQSLWQQQRQSLPQQRFDSEWISPCQVGKPQEGKIEWAAVKRTPPVDLSNIEQALDVQLHPSIAALLCSAYADCIPCLFDGHHIELIQAWNEADFKLLQENMVGHFLMQKRLKKPTSMFIASCSDEMQIISILNATGQVQLETLGKGQEAILAENVADFLALLEPTIIE
ncbi:SecY-interacting protein [Psychromonas antarctica]|jgi:SecY interacting protein Syd|uniref:SecY-interacting protein n=1 Tax=Psychromonas antarctica TaxID=67573 RepID=UPI001EE8D0B1|nr:SecY-interacting protein [Psychromonas antarctica]MCG6201267.1 SecY-interacting protein [Psychromonas antarctica]